MNLDLKQQLEQSFGDGPAHPPVSDRIAAGRRALLRRRAGTALAGVATVAVAFVAFSTIASDDTATPPVTPPTPSTTQPVEVALTAAVPVDTTWRVRCGQADEPQECGGLGILSPLVGYQPSGQLARLDANVSILQRYDDPVTISGGDSVALETRTSLGVRWFYLTWQDGRSETWVANPSGARVSFEQFARRLADRRDVPAMPELTRLESLIG